MEKQKAKKYMPIVERMDHLVILIIPFGGMHLKVKRTLIFRQKDKDKFYLLQHLSVLLLESVLIHE